MTYGASAPNAQKVEATQQANTSFGAQPARNPSDLAVSLSGEAVAVGENTATDANLYCRAYDRGAVQVAFGSAWLSAAALSPAGQTAYASTAAAVGFAGADFSYSATERWQGGSESQEGAWSAEISQTRFVAFNVTGWDVALGSVDLQREAPLASSGWPTIQGNVASFRTDAAAYGDDSFVQADAMVLATNGISISSSYAMVGAGGPDAGPAPILRGDGRDVIFTSSSDSFVNSGGGSDWVTAGDGDDWILAGSGDDMVLTGRGHNTVLAGMGDDGVVARDGDDWIFGGDGRDLIAAGAGNNIVNGGAGNDTITAGSGDDVIVGGLGNDVIDAGDGRNFIQLGVSGASADGNDLMTGGGGADTFFLRGGFGRDTINGFVVTQGDRLVPWNDPLDPYGGSNLLDGDSAFLARSRLDPRDLTITFGNGPSASVLTLDNFFQLNPGYASPTSRTTLTDAQIAAIRHDVFTDDSGAAKAIEYFAISDYLGLIG